MHHSHRLAGGGGDHIDLGIHARERLFQNHHGKHRGSGRHIARAHRHGVGGCHARTGIALGRAQRRARLQRSGGVQQLCALGSKHTGPFACCEHLGQDIADLPPKAFFCDQRVIRIQHGGIVIIGLAVDGEHSACFAHAQHLFAGQLPMYIACQRGEKRDLLYMVFPVQHRLLQMRNAPALRNVKAEAFRQLLGGRARNGVAPGAEGCQLLPILVKGQIAVHHGRNAHGGNVFQRQAVGVFHIGCHVGIGLLQPLPHLAHGIGPQAVFIMVFPCVIARGQGRVIRADQHRLNAGRAQLDAQIHLPGCNDLLVIHKGFLLTCSFLSDVQTRSAAQ